MEARRRHVVGANDADSRNNNTYILEQDSDCDDDHHHKPLITRDVLQVYEEEEDEAKLRQHYFLTQRARRRGMSERKTYLMILAAISVICYVVHLATWRHVAKIKAEMGHTERYITDEHWWSSSVVYYIDPRSFQDSDGDGMGDIPGTISRLDHLDYLGVGAVLLAPIMDMDDTEHVTNFQQIDPRFGTMQDFDRLLKELHERDIKLILDLVPNHTSNKHPWFLESRKAVTMDEGTKEQVKHKYADYYVWSPGLLQKDGTRKPPNNWLSHHGGSAWTFDDVRGEYYFHQYGADMPDLNHHNPKIRDEMMEIFQFWVDKGVDGINMLDMDVLFEIDELDLNEPKSGAPDAKPGEYKYLDHIYTHDQPELHEYMATWRELLDAHMLKTKRKVFLSVDVEDDMLQDVLKYYDTGVDAPLNTLLSEMDEDCDGVCLNDVLDQWLDEMPPRQSTMWMLSSPAVGRLSRGAFYQPVMAVLQMMLPGSAVIYYGDEIGMQSLKVTHTDSQVVHYVKPGMQAPMRWDSSQHHGFSTVEQIWTSIESLDGDDINVKAQKEAKSSLLQIYHKLSILRKEPSVQKGGFKNVVINSNMYSFLRYTKESVPFLVAVNVGKMPATHNYATITGVKLGKVIIYARGDLNAEPVQTFIEGDNIELAEMTLYPGDALVLKLF